MYSCFILKMIWFGLVVLLEIISVARVREVDIILGMPGRGVNPGVWLRGT